MTNSPLLHQSKDGIALLTLNRPDKLNAISSAMIEALMAALDRIERDRKVRTVILTGAGLACAKRQKVARERLERRRVRKDSAG